MINGNNIKLSIIIPTYNRAGLLPRTIKSIQSQKCNDDIEIIIIDDGSTDDTKNVIHSLAQIETRIRCVFLPKNRGVNYARNAGIKCATGKWISLLDSDDEYVSGGLAIILSTLSQIGSDIELIGFMTLRETNGVMKKRGYDIKGLWKSYTPTYEDIVLKEKIKGDIHYCIRQNVFSERFRFPQDVQSFETLFFADVAKHGKKFLYLNEIVDQRHNDPGYHLGDEPFKRWPKEYAVAYKRFVREHYDVLQKHPNRLLHFYLRITKCLLITGNIHSVVWFLKLTILKIKLLIIR